MNIDKMTDKCKDILIKGIMDAKERHNPELTTEHLLKAYLEDEDIIDFIQSNNQFQ